MLILKKEFFAQIVKQCQRELPNEACGILAGRDEMVEKVYEMTNVRKSPSAYLMEAREQIKTMKEMRNLGLKMIGIYHSHVASRAYPSEEDLELAFYPEAYYAIISLKDKDNPEIGLFKIREGKINEEEVSIE